MDKTLDPEALLQAVPPSSTDSVSGRDPGDVAHFFDLRALSRAYRQGELSQGDYLSRRRDLILAFQACLGHEAFHDDRPVTSSAVLNALEKQDRRRDNPPFQRPPKRDRAVAATKPASKTAFQGLLPGLRMSEIYAQAASREAVGDLEMPSCPPLDLIDRPSHQAVQKSSELALDRVERPSEPTHEHAHWKESVEKIDAKQSLSSRATSALTNPERWRAIIDQISWRSLAILGLLAATGFIALWMTNWLAGF